MSKLRLGTLPAGFIAPCQGAVGNVMDFDRIRGGGLPGSPPPPRRLFAADRLAEADRILYDGDYCIIEKIAGIGYSLERCASELLGHHPSKLGNYILDSLDLLG
jgi:hypothetical protein